MRLTICSSKDVRHGCSIVVVVISVLIIMKLTFPLPLPPAIPTTMGSIFVMLALERNE